MRSRNSVPGWGLGANSPHAFFSLPSLLFAERGQQGGFESFIFYFQGGLGAEPP